MDISICSNRKERRGCGLAILIRRLGKKSDRNNKTRRKGGNRSDYGQNFQMKKTNKHNHNLWHTRKDRRITRGGKETDEEMGRGSNLKNKKK